MCVALVACGNTAPTTPDVAISTTEDPLTGQNGVLAVSAANTVVNQYAVLGASVAAGTNVITITNAGDFTATGAFATTLAKGDLLMLYQPQGATITATDTADFGTVTALNGAGNYELVHVAAVDVTGLIITLETTCGGLVNSYTRAGATEVIRVPQATTITVAAGASIVAAPWDGARGGVVALQAQTTVTVNGAIDATGDGFRGGVIDNTTTGPPGTSIFRATGSAAGGEKGESIAGFQAHYDSAFNGRYGRGAPANGGGGGDAHNAAGGGGANGDDGSAYTGAGIMDNTVTGGSAAWPLDPDFVLAGGLTASSGGGRGGYTYSANDQNALVLGPGSGSASGSGSWGGDLRRDVGGLGGRPVANDPTARLFLGGGGGAGDGNNSAAGGGGAGGGLVLLIANSVGGAGTIQSNGAVGNNTTGTVNNDAPGGGGGGGTVIVMGTAVATVAVHADGGAGGNQLRIGPEAEGPGGGGGGGYVAIAGGTVTQTAAGAIGGTTLSTALTEFPSNGATSGAAGQANQAAVGLLVCVVDDLSITITDGATTATPGNPVTYTIVATNGGADVITGATVTDTFPATLTNVSWTCAASTGGSCPAATGTGNISALVTLAASGTVTYTVTATIDPTATGTLSDTAKVAAPATVTDTNQANNSATDSDALVGSADLQITGTASPDPVAAGGTLTYALTVKDAGPSAAANLTVTDTIPVGSTFVSASGTGWACTEPTPTTVSCTRASLGVTTAPTISIVVTAPTTTGTITDTANVSPTAGDPNTANNATTITSNVSASADLSVTLTDSPDPVSAGGTLTYTVGVANAGPTSATSVTVTDTLPPGATFVSASGTGWTCTEPTASTVTCTRPTAATGAQPPITIVVTAPTTPGAATDSVTVGATTGDPSPANNSASQTTTVTASADLSVSVAESPDPVVAGGTVTYTVSSANAGPNAAATVTLTDTIPAGSTFVSASGTGWTCTEPTATTVRCTRPTAASGAQPDVTIVVTAPGAAGTITDSAAISATTADPNLANNTASVTSGVSGSADLSISITGAPDPVTAGTNLTYTVGVSNAGPSTASTVSVTDTLPAGATFVSASGTGWTCLQAGGVVTCTRPSAATGAQPAITIVVTAPGAGPLTDSGAVTASTTDPDTTNNTATATTNVTGSADLSIALTGTPDPVVAGGMLTYTATVTNNGPSTATSVSVTDTLPAGATFVSATGTGWTCVQSGQTVTCTEPSAAAGAQNPISIVIGAPANGPTATDTASVTAGTGDPKPANNTATVTTDVTGAADLAVTLAANPSPVTAGGALTYTVSTANLGPSTAATVVVTDTLPVGVTFVSATGTGWACTETAGVVTCTVAAAAAGGLPDITIVTTAPAAGGSITDTAGITSQTADPNLANNAATVTTDVTASADVSVTVTGAPDPVTAGGTLTYTVNVDNSGPSDAGMVTVTDTLPVGATFVSADGTGWSCTQAGQVVTCTEADAAPGAQPPLTIIATAPADGGPITDTVNAMSATTGDPDPTNNTATTTTDVSASADLGITITANPSPVATGSTLTYTLGVTNAGPSSASTVTVTDTLPAGATFVSASGTGWTCTQVGQVVTCTASTLAVGADPSVTITVTAPGTPGTLVDGATVGSTVTADPSLGNNTATNSTAVQTSADLGVTVTAAPDPVTAGGLVTYTVGVTNAGPSDASGVTVTDTLPDGETFISAGGPGWTCSAVGQVVTCTETSLTPGAAGSITIVATAPTTPGALTDTVTVSSATADADAGNNTATVTSTVAGSTDADVGVSITATPDPVQVGGALTYTVTVQNLGPGQATGVTVTDTLPAGETLTSFGGTGWTCTQAGQVVTCTLASLDDGSTSTLTLTVTAPSSTGTTTDTVTVTTASTDPVAANNTASISADISDDDFGVRGGGCNTTGGGSAGGLAGVLGALALTLGKRRVARRALLAVSAAAAAAVVVGAPTAAHAQIAGSPQTFNVERFRMSIDGEGIESVEWAGAPARYEWNVGIWLGYANDPLVVYDLKTNQRVESLVHNRFGGSVFGAVSLAKWLEIGLEVPLIFDQDNSGIETLPSPDSPKLGDIKLSPKFVLRQGSRDRVGVAVMLAVTAPSGGSSGYAGDDNVTFQPELIVSRAFGGLRLSGSVGYLARKETQFANIRIDDEINFRAGVGYRFADRESGWNKPLELDATFLLATQAATPFEHINTDAYEVDVSAGYRVHRDVTLYGLFGEGIGAGFGAPDWRITVGARYTHHTPPPAKVVVVVPPTPQPIPEPKPAPILDTDGDGLLDNVDKCPTEPEDKDGFQDEDGCPDPDNDGDGVLDVVDKCPLQPGPASNDGCPDPDRDGDGTVDRLDNCPDVPGPPENAGCPNKQLVKITDTKLEILESVYFKLDKAVIEKRSFALLDNVAAVLTTHPTIAIQVEGHTDSQGKPAYNKDLSQRRAQAVLEYLVKKGVDKARLKPIGFGQDKPVADNKTAEGRAQNRRVVFTILGADGAAIENKQQGAGSDTTEPKK